MCVRRHWTWCWTWLTGNWTVGARQVWSWATKPGSRVAACYTGGTDQEGNGVRVGRIGSRPMKINEGKEKGEGNSLHHFACKAGAGWGYQFWNRDGPGRGVYTQLLVNKHSWEATTFYAMCQIPTDIIWKSLYSHGTSGLGCWRKLILNWWYKSKRKLGFFC